MGHSDLKRLSPYGNLSSSPHVSVPICVIITDTNPPLPPGVQDCRHSSRYELKFSDVCDPCRMQLRIWIDASAIINHVAESCTDFR